jgi:hypothetical protein
LGVVDIDLWKWGKTAVDWLAWVAKAAGAWQGLKITVGLAGAVVTVIWSWLEGFPKSLILPAAIWTCLGVLWLWDQIKRKLPAVGREPVTSQPTTTADPTQFARYVKVFRAEAVPVFDATDPYMSFIFWVFNGWHQPISIQPHVKGAPKYFGEKLGGKTELDAPGPIQPGSEEKFRILQWVSQETKKLIQRTPVTGDALSEFGFDTVFVNVVSDGVEARLDVPTLSNYKRDTWRIRWPNS